MENRSFHSDTFIQVQKRGTFKNTGEVNVLSHSSALTITMSATVIYYAELWSGRCYKAQIGQIHF